jgi:hypothetical protein
VCKPRVLEVRLTNAGRADIPSSAFDRETPVTIDVGGRVVALIPAGVGESAVRADIAGDEVRIPPMLIRRRQVLTLRALVEAPQRPVSVSAELIEVDVLQDASGGPARMPLRRVLAIMAAGILVTSLTRLYLLPSDAQKGHTSAAVSLYSCIIGVTGYVFIGALIPTEMKSLSWRSWLRFRDPTASPERQP